MNDFGHCQTGEKAGRNKDGFESPECGIAGLKSPEIPPKNPSAKLFRDWIEGENMRNGHKSHHASKRRTALALVCTVCGTLTCGRYPQAVPSRRKARGRPAR